MNITQYINNLPVIFWNIIAFLCPCISKDNLTEKKNSSFPLCVSFNNYFSSVYSILKEFLNKIFSKQTDNNSVTISTELKNIYKNKNSVSNRTNHKNSSINQAIKFADLLYTKRLKVAQATQNLISRVHFVRLQDKCVQFSPFALQNYHCLYIF